MPNSYSQNGEDLIVLDYFNGKVGNVLEVGANNGKDFSNSLALIEAGWSAYLIEPGNPYHELIKLHRDRDNVLCFNFAIGKECGSIKFYESGAHVANGSDIGLVSTIDYEETVRWRKSGVQFTETSINVRTFEDFIEGEGNPTLDFISIDAEGYDWKILRQINLDRVGCKVLCIEWNGDGDLLFAYKRHCNQFGLKEIHRNGENIIFAR